MNIINLSVPAGVSSPVAASVAVGDRVLCMRAFGTIIVLDKLM